MCGHALTLPHKGHVEAIELLLQAGAPVDPMNNSAWTPLHRAAYNGRKVLHGGSGFCMWAFNRQGFAPRGHTWCSQLMEVYFKMV